MPPKKKTKAKVPEPEPEPEYEEEEPLVIANANEGEIEDDEGGVTRCVCKIADEDMGMMIQCETCKVWQHGLCVGFENESECPETYYCELCRPDLHVDLLKSLKKAHHRNASSAMHPPSTTHDHTPHKLTAANLLASATASTSQSQSSRSQSPPIKSSSTRRRNTFNSRGPAYEEALQAGDLDALEKIAAPEDEEGATGGKRKRKRSGGVGNDEANAPKRKRSSEVPGSTTPDPQDPNELDSPQKDAQDGPASVNGSLKNEATIRRGKRAKKEKEPSQETEATASNPPPPNPPPTKKHANQYTYRGKTNNNGTASPNKGTPTASARAGHAGSAAPEAGRRTGGTNTGNSAAASANSRTATSPAPPPLTWNLPDHLSHLADLLPSPTPVGIEVRLGPGIDRTLEKGAKVRWPMKRTTVGEMRRRVRAMLDYVTKAQGDALEREKRVKALDAALAKAAEEEQERAAAKGKGKTTTDNSPSGEDSTKDASMTESPKPISEETAPSEPPAPAAPVSVTTSTPTTNTQEETTAERLASLTQGLLQFQEKFGAGPGGKIYRERIERERRPRGAAAAAAAAMERDD
ncbi:hypothetical protein FRC03_008041 [Tulasnella sp. 419]|nr:hypothetical protein FRC03_008041 [Tulasnella sp. 419]